MGGNPAKLLMDSVVFTSDIYDSLRKTRNYPVLDNVVEPAGWFSENQQAEKLNICLDYNFFKWHHKLERPFTELCASKFTRQIKQKSLQTD